jgi:membrane peptidoglycan carboxypeptidase
MVGALAVMGAASQGLPDMNRLGGGYEIRILDRNHHLITAVSDDGTHYREVPLAEISPYLQEATVAAEDRHFYDHHGFDVARTAKAAVVDVVSRRPDEGASTITQQLARMSLRDYDKNALRKVREALLTMEIETRLDKQHILELYLNHLNYGHHAYGAEAAARTYFGRSARDLSLAQAALLAGLPQRPSYDDPTINFDAARDRQLYVLDQMVRDGDITDVQASVARFEDVRKELVTRPDDAGGTAPHCVQYVLDQLDQMYGADVVSHSHLTVTTTLDTDVQSVATRLVAAAPAQLSAQGINNAGLLVTDPGSGEILAMVGSAGFGSDAIAGQVNITTVPRQPGSTFKPYVYLAGIQGQKFDTLTPFQDAPGLMPTQDFDNRYLGTMTLRTSLVESRNVPAEAAMSQAGPQNVIDTAHRIGVSSPLDPGLSTAIGASAVSMLEQATAYGALATEGTRHDPVAILDVTDAATGHHLHLPDRSGQAAADPRAAYIIGDVLRGYGARWHLGFDRPMAAKSGTTNIGGATGDGWLIAYNPAVVIVAWAGHTSSDRTAGNQTHGFYGVELGPMVVSPLLRAFPSRWQADLVRPAGLRNVACGWGAWDEGAPYAGELVLSEDHGAHCSGGSAGPRTQGAPGAGIAASPSPTPRAPRPAPTPCAVPLLGPICPTPRP